MLWLDSLIWWGLFWRHLVFFFPAYAIVVFIEGLVGLGQTRIITALSGVIASVPIQIYAVGAVLHREFRGFSIRLVASPR